MSKTPSLNQKQIAAFAAYAQTATISPPLNFYSVTIREGMEYIFEDMYPPLHAPGTLDFFFFAMIHNYGFWQDDGKKYTSPLVGTWNGTSGVKGSDLLWKILHAAWKKEPECFSPPRLATISDAEFAAMFSDDSGPIPLFNIPRRIALTRDYGRWYRTRRMAGQSPMDLVKYASEYSDPVSALREVLTHPENGVPGYREDPLGKKAELLLMALVNRPDKLLTATERTVWNPIVDYHGMRLALRMGLISISAAWRDENIARQLTSPQREELIRGAVKKSAESVIRLSGRTMAEIDNLMWSARAFCPEMSAPHCGACLLQSFCAKKVALFQPTIRTTFY